MPEHAYLHFADQEVVAADFLFLNQAQLAQLFKMMVSDAWTAEVQGALDFPYTHGMTVFQEKPVDFPSFASKCILNLSRISRSQSARPSQIIIPDKKLISPILGHAKH